MGGGWVGRPKGRAFSALRVGAFDTKDGFGPHIVATCRWDDVLQRHSDLESKQSRQVTASNREALGRLEGSLANRVRRGTEQPRTLWKTRFLFGGRAQPVHGCATLDGVVVLCTAHRPR